MRKGVLWSFFMTRYDTNEKYAVQHCTSSQHLRAKPYTFCLKKHKRFISHVFLASFRRRRKKAPLDSLLFLSESDLVYFSLTSFFKFPGTQFWKERKKNIITSFSGKFLSRRSILSFVIYDNFTSTTTIHAIKTFLHDEKNKSKSLLF